MGSLRELSSKAVAAWNERRLDDLYALYEDDVVFHAPDGRTLQGVQALRGQYDVALAWCPDLRIEALVVVADDEAGLLASLQREQGTAVDGTPFAFEGMTFFRIGSDGRIAEVWEQMRVLPAGSPST